MEGRFREPTRDLTAPIPFHSIFFMESRASGRPLLGFPFRQLVVESRCGAALETMANVNTMRTSLLTLLIPLLSTALAVVGGTPAKCMSRWVESYNGNDAKVMASFYEDSRDVDCLVSAGLWLKGHEDISAMYRDDMNAIRFYGSGSENMNARVSGDTAVVSLIHRFNYEIRESPEKYRIQIRTTATLLRDGESWNIISENSSPTEGIERAVSIEE
jgi:ketosteroid isomerase-like protein